MQRDLGRLLIITDRRAAAAAGRELVDAVALALSGVAAGEAVVQLREKDLPARELLALARALLEVTRERRCPLLVNDRIDVALAAAADGAHLPEEGLDIATARRLARRSDFLIGCSVHGADAAGAATRDGADLVLCGPVFATPSKQGLGEPLGPDELARAAAAVAGAGGKARLYAVGGIEGHDQATACAAAGADGVAGIRAFMSASDPAASAATLAAAIPPRA